MENGESLLEAMLGFAADEEVLQSGHDLFYGHLKGLATVSPEAKASAQRFRVAEYVGVDNSALVGDQVDVNNARTLLGLKLTGTTGNQTIEEHIGARLGLPRALWPEHMTNIATFADSLAALQDKSAGELQIAFRTALDLAANRLDAWITSLATRRLDAMRDTAPEGVHLGAFGVVENLLPDSTPTPARRSTASATCTRRRCNRRRPRRCCAAPSSPTSRPPAARSTSTCARTASSAPSGCSKGSPTASRWRRCSAIASSARCATPACRSSCSNAGAPSRCGPPARRRATSRRKRSRRATSSTACA